MPTYGMIIMFLLSLIAVIKGGDWFVDSAVYFAKVLGIPQVIVGATIVSIGTTLPETLISSFAAVDGSGTIVLGTALGSILFNTGVILGVNTLITPITVRHRDTFFKIGSMIGVISLLWILSLNGLISRFDSNILLVLLGAYLLTNVWSGSKSSGEEKQTIIPKELTREVAFFLIGLIMVVGGARFLLDSGVELAKLLGVSETIIALTLFAIGSSLPELITSVSAALKGHSGLFFGNILGANTLNIILVIGISGAIRPFILQPAVVSREMVSILVLMGILVVPAFVNNKISRLQGAAATLFYLGYITFITLSK